MGKTYNLDYQSSDSSDEWRKNELLRDRTQKIFELVSLTLYLFVKHLDL
jgi:hypothetical protein